MKCLNPSSVTNIAPRWVGCPTLKKRYHILNILFRLTTWFSIRYFCFHSFKSVIETSCNAFLILSLIWSSGSWNWPYKPNDKTEGVTPFKLLVAALCLNLPNNDSMTSDEACQIVVSWGIVSFYQYCAPLGLRRLLVTVCYRYFAPLVRFWTRNPHNLITPNYFFNPKIFLNGCKFCPIKSLGNLSPSGKPTGKSASS